MPRRPSVTQRILAYYEAHPAADVPAAQAARDLSVDGKILASILSRLAREGAVSRVSRGVYRSAGAPRALPDLSGLSEGLRRTLLRTFGEDALSRMELALPAAPVVEDLRAFHLRLRRYLGDAAADDLVRKVAAGTIGAEASANLLRRLAEA